MPDPVATRSLCQRCYVMVMRPEGKLRALNSGTMTIGSSES